jgi:hypothetical protein
MIWGPHSGGYEDFLLGYIAVYTGESEPIFFRNTQSYIPEDRTLTDIIFLIADKKMYMNVCCYNYCFISSPKMEAVRSSAMSVSA